MKWLYLASEMPGLWPWLQTNATSWVQLCGWTENSFVEWTQRKNVLVVPFEGGFILLEEAVVGLKVVLHPLFDQKSFIHNFSQMRTILRELQRLLKLERIEIHILSTAGHTLRRLARQLGFHHEGTLRADSFDYRFNPPHLIDTEVWSILRIEILEENNGTI